MCVLVLVQLDLVIDASVSVSGHSNQRAQKLEDNLFPEEDGKDEIMLTIDGKEIRDNASVNHLHLQPFDLPGGRCAETVQDARTAIACRGQPFRKPVLF